jgi:hypothetical protein
VEHPVDDLAEELHVVRDDDQPALERVEVVPQPDHRVRVEVVRRLVEQERLGPAEQDPGELDPPTLTARERMQRLAEHAGVEAEGGGDRRGLGLGRIATGTLELGLEPRIPAHGPLHRLGVGTGHALLRRDPVRDDPVQSAGAEDTVVGEHAEVAGAGVLREVADGAAADDRAGGGLADTRENLGQGRLAGAVAADQTDPVPGCDAEARVLQEQARAGAQLDVGSSDHGGGTDSGGTGAEERAMA